MVWRRTAMPQRVAAAAHRRCKARHATAQYSRLAGSVGAAWRCVRFADALTHSKNHESKRGPIVTCLRLGCDRARDLARARSGRGRQLSCRVARRSGTLRHPYRCRHVPCAATRRARTFRSRIHKTANRVRPSSVRADNATRATMLNDMADVDVSPIAFSEPFARRAPVSRARRAVRPLASRCARQRLAAASLHARVQLRHANRRTGVDARRLAQASVRRTAKVLEHDGCALLSFAPCRACARARRKVARRSSPMARRALGRGASYVACRSRAVFDDGVAFGTLQKSYRSRPTSHISQHRLTELRDRFGHRRFFE